MPSPRINVVKCLLSGAIFCTVLVSRSPAAIGLSPTIAAPGSSTVITASSFIGTSQATFNGHQAVFQVDSATKITAIVPLAATTGLVEVTTPSGTATGSIAKIAQVTREASGGLIRTES